MSFWQLTQVIGSPPQSYFLGFPISNYANGVEKVSSRSSVKPNGSVLQKLLYGCRNVARLRQDHVFELRLGRAERIHSRDALDWRVWVFKKVVPDPPGGLPALSPPQKYPLNYNYPGGLADPPRNRFPTGLR